ncbi:MAG: preprotein translocase subunit YajC [Saprospiraceae bacterium]|nr:preprotein translocase subunit YajC [Saprospiraceae bacterium]
MTNLTIFLQTGGGAGLMSFLPMIAIAVVFYLFLIRPQQKKQKEQTGFMDSLQKGDSIVTASGILGTINKIEDDIVTLDVGNKNYIRVTRNAISKEMTESVHGAKS